MSSTAIYLSDLKKLLNILAPLAGNWEVFLIALGVSGSERAVIQAQHAHSPNFPTLCLVDGLERWVKSRNSPTYGNIIEALNSKFITDKPLAAQIEGFAQQKSEERTAVRPVKPVPAALPQPLSVYQPTSSGGTSCEPTCPPHQTSTTPADTHTVPAEPASQPQPTSDVDTKVVSLSDLNELLDVLVAIAGKWQLFLIALGVSINDISEIRVEHAHLPGSPKLCLLDGLDRWVKSSDLPTYGRIIEALHSNSFTNKPLARNVYEFARQLCQKKGMQPVKPTSPPHQTSPCPVHHERYDKAQASAKHKELRKCFISQAVQLKDHLKAKYTDEKLPDFLKVFILALPSTVKDENEKFFHDKSLEISRSKTFDELFIHLDAYWDYLNYTLLEGVIEAHGTEMMQQEMESYVRDLQEYRRKTKLFVYWQVERHKKGRTPPPGFRQVVTKHSITGESTLEDIEKIRLEIAQEFHLSKFALRLIDVVECCVLITWFVPSSIISQLQERLGSLTGLHIEDVFYGSSDIPQDPPNPHDSGSPASPHSTKIKHTPSSPDLTALFHTAAESGDADTVRKLLKDGVDINEKRDGTTAVMLAARNGHADIVSILMESGADPNVRDPISNTPLMLAAREGHTATVRALGTGSVNINASDSRGQTALMWAAERGHTNTVQALGALGADLHVQNADGRTALLLAAMCGHTDTVQALAALGADLHVQDTIWGQTALMLAAWYGHTDTVQALATLGADIHIKDKFGQTALIWAAEHGRTSTVQALAALGADIHIKDRDGRTALMLAAECGYTDTVQALATLGADVHVKDETGRTALMLAAMCGHTDIVQALAALGADIHIKDQHGKTALLLAAAYGHTDTLQTLEALGADMHVKDRHGRTVQMLLARHGRTHPMVQARVNIPSIEKESYLSYSESHFIHPTSPSPPTALKSLRSTTIDEFSSEKEESYLSYSESGKGSTRAFPPPVTPGASQPGEKELMKAKTSQHREHPQP